MTLPAAPRDLVPPGWSAAAPILDDVIVRWHEGEAAIADWESATAVIDARQPAGWAATVEHLQLINTFQWHEEDRSRDHAADDAVLAAVKRSIDASNRRRVQTVDRLDDMIHAGLVALGQVNPAAPLNSESPGSILDRLTVLALKIHHVGEACAALAAGPERAAMQARLDGLCEQRDDLGRCLDALLDGIRTGRVGLKLYRQVKVYRQADTGALKADLE
ncbi:MAG TPA: DUF4254 domain-containing protein [Candidatus Krumholzibacteria bacterium]|nr:DUF4254 domain-containing protein [Candidatus Krumholzibacteria bacterium]